MDKELDRVTFYFFVSAINVALKIGAEKNNPWAAHQCLQQSEFASRQAADFVAAANLEGRRVEADAAVAEDRRRAAPLPAQDRTHPRQELTRLKRLDQIVVGTEIKTRNPIVDAVACGHDDNGDCASLLAQASQNFESVE